MEWAAVLIAALLASAQFYGEVHSVLVELEGKDPGDPHYRRAVELLNEAIDAYESGDYGLASSLLEEARSEALLASGSHSRVLMAVAVFTASLALGIIIPLAAIVAWYWTRRDWVVEEG